jgi:hypothetical protein
LSRTRLFWCESLSLYRSLLILYSGISMKYDNVYAGKSKISKVTIISIVAPIAGSVLLLVLAYCFLSRRARKKSNAIKGEKSKKCDLILIYQGMKVVLYSNHVSLLELLNFQTYKYMCRDPLFKACLNCIKCSNYYNFYYNSFINYRDSS